MGKVVGIESKAALKKATTWNTPVAAGSGDGFLFESSSVKSNINLLGDDSLGTYYQPEGIPGAETVNGDVGSILRYDGFDLLLYLFCGSASTRTQQASSAAYAWAYPLAATIAGLFGTLVIKEGANYVKEVGSAKIGKLTISGKYGEPLKIQAAITGDTMSFNTTTGTNTNTTAANITIAESANPVRFAQGVFRMNAQGGAALSSGDKINPSEFTLTMTRDMEGQYGTYTAGTTSVHDVIDEPVEKGAPTYELSLTFPSHTDPTMLQELRNDTRKKLDITFTGGLIESTYYRKLLIQCPAMQYKDAQANDGKGIIPLSVTYQLLAPTSAPTGMTGILEPVRLSGINTKTANP